MKPEWVNKSFSGVPVSARMVKNTAAFTFVIMFPENDPVTYTD